MADVNLGTVSAKIDLDTALLNQRVDEVLALWEQIQKMGEKTTAGLSEKMVAGLKQYQQQLTSTATLMERQIQLIEQMEAAANKPVTGGNSAEEAEDAANAIEEEKAALKKLEAQFNSVYNAQREFIAQQDKTAKTTEQTAQKMDLRKAGANVKAGMDMAAAGLNSIDKIFPGLAGDIGDVITQISSTGQAIAGAGTIGLKWAAGITGAIGIAGTVVAMGIQQMQKAEEERQKAFEEGVQKSKEYAEQLMTLETNIQIMEDATSTTEQVTAARQDLASTFTDIVVGWDNEGNAIIANNEELESYKESLKEEIQIEREKTALQGKEKPDAYAKKAKELEKLQKSLSSYSYYLKLDKTSDLNDYQRLMIGKGQDALKQINSTKSELLTLKQETKSYYTAEIQGLISVQDGISGTSKGWDDLSSAEKAAGNSIIRQSLPALLDGTKNYKQVVDEITQKLGDPAFMSQFIANLKEQDEYQKMIAVDFQDELDALNSLSGAYNTLADGQQLSISQLYTLSQQYPEIADYIAQTGDYTLQNGEILKQVYEAERLEYIQSLQRNREKLIDEQTVTEATIANISFRITALQNLAKAEGMVGIVSAKLAAETQAELEEPQKKLQEIQDALKRNAAQMKMAEDAANIDFTGGSGKKKSSSSSASSKNEALAAELKQIERKKKLDELTGQQELDWLQRIQKKYKMNADEKYDLEYRIYSLQKQLQQEAEQAATERLNAEYKAMENKKSLGELTAKEELEWLQKIQKTFRMNTDEQMDLEIKLYNLKQQLHEEDVSALNTIGDAVTEALRQKYEQQKKEEQDRINSSIESWETWEKETCDAIQGQIDALDELEKQQESEEKRREYENKRNVTNLLLQYEQDDYNRRQLEKQLAQMDAEEQKRLDAEAREAERKRLEEEMEKTQDAAQKQEDALQEELDKLDEAYDKLTSDFALRAEAEKAIMNSTQQEIVALIKSYAPEYDLAGQSIGEKLVDGFKAKTGGIVEYLDGLMKKVQEYQANMAYTANKAADDFWAKRMQYDQQIAASAAPKVEKAAPVVNMTVQFNQPVQSPIETRRQLDRVAEDLARRIGG